MADRPNVLFYFVDNLGFGELGCYGGGVLRGADTARIEPINRRCAGPRPGSWHLMILRNTDVDLEVPPWK